VAIVTGGAGLLGSEFCRTLAEAGAQVVVADIDREAAEEVAESINADERSPARQNQIERAFSVPVDVTSPDSVRQLVGTVLDKTNRLDILVNSAAIDPKSESQEFEDYPLDLWDCALAVNLTGTFLACQAVARPMMAQGKGVIVNLSSIYALAGPDQRIYQHEGRPPQYKPAYYSATKAGVLGLTRYLATYCAGKGIRVNALSPGGVFDGHDEAFVEVYSARTVLGRMARKDELNGALLFLASDASGYMTGANLVVDGGWTAW
jgi:2-deoxy-D-gluconate 3-dehydrogenase